MESSRAELILDTPSRSIVNQSLWEKVGRKRSTGMIDDNALRHGERCLS